MELTTSQIDSFNEDGFIILDDFYNLEELYDIENSLKHLILTALEKASNVFSNVSVEDYQNSAYNEGLVKLEKLNHQYIIDIYNTICQVPEFLRLITKLDTTDCVNQLLERDSKRPLYIFTPRCRIDPPNYDVRKTKWHQEVFYTIPKSEFFQTWAPIVNDATIHNGTIQVCAGSHKEGIAKQSWSKDKSEPTPFVIDEDIIKKYKIIDVEMKKGQLMIFNSRLFHRSGNNSSNQVRYTLIGMYHNTENLDFEPPSISTKFKTSPEKFYEEMFGSSKK